MKHSKIARLQEEARLLLLRVARFLSLAAQALEEVVVVSDCTLRRLRLARVQHDVRREAEHIFAPHAMMRRHDGAPVYGRLHVGREFFSRLPQLPPTDLDDERSLTK